MYQASDGSGPFEPGFDCPLKNATTSTPGPVKVPCQEWSFAKDKFKRTAVTDNNWVCDDEYKIANVFFAGPCGAVFGVLVFNNLSDIIGRR